MTPFQWMHRFERARAEARRTMVRELFATLSAWMKEAPELLKLKPSTVAAFVKLALRETHAPAVALGVWEAALMQAGVQRVGSVFLLPDLVLGEHRDWLVNVLRDVTDDVQRRAMQASERRERNAAKKRNAKKRAA